jgi:hypothetical protein
MILRHLHVLSFFQADKSFQYGALPTCDCPGTDGVILHRYSRRPVFAYIL